MSSDPVLVKQLAFCNTLRCSLDRDMKCVQHLSFLHCVFTFKCLCIGSGGAMSQAVSNNSKTC